MSIRRRQAFCLIALLGGSALGGGCAAPSRPSLAIIPLPDQMDIGRGGFDLDDGTRITLSDPADAELRRLANFWGQPVRAATGFDLPIAGEAGDATSNIISLQLSDAAAEHPEGYRLTVTSGSPRDARSRDDFVQRLPRHLRRLDALGVNYRPPELPPVAQ